MNITDPYEAYCFDEAIAHVGTVIEADLEKVEGKTEAEIERKRRAVLEEYFPETADKNSKRGAFADPMTMFNSR